MRAAAEVITADTNKTLAMSISFGRISSAQFWNAFEERLAPLMQAVRAAQCSVRELPVLPVS